MRNKMLFIGIVLLIVAALTVTCVLLNQIPDERNLIIIEDYPVAIW